MSKLLLLALLTTCLSTFACTAEEAPTEEQGESSSELRSKKTAAKKPTSTSTSTDVAMSDEYKCFRACGGRGIADCSACGAMGIANLDRALEQAHAEDPTDDE